VSIWYILRIRTIFSTKSCSQLKSVVSFSWKILLVLHKLIISIFLCFFADYLFESTFILAIIAKISGECPKPEVLKPCECGTGRDYYISRILYTSSAFTVSSKLKIQNFSFGSPLRYWNQTKMILKKYHLVPSLRFQ
jgi:hypothetical protein